MSAPAPPSHPAADSPAGLRALSTSLRAQVDAFLAESPADAALGRAQAQTRRSLGIIEEAVRRFGLDALALSYNGGKDCLVLLVLYLAALPGVLGQGGEREGRSGRAPGVAELLAAAEDAGAAASSAASTPPRTPVPGSHPLDPLAGLPAAAARLAPYPSLLRSIYIVSPHPFPEVDAFVARTAADYRLALARRSDPSMRAAFAQYLGDHPAVRAVLVGTRRTDPHGKNLAEFAETDSGWPKFTRVHPVLEWRYAEIWAFIRHLRIPYCELYDAGYTSLGGIMDTRPNPVLRIGEEEKYRPAYELEAEEEERLGRN